MKAHCIVCNLWFNSHEQFLAHEVDDLHIKREEEKLGEMLSSATSTGVTSSSGIPRQVPEQSSLFGHMVKNQLAMPDVTFQSVEKKDVGENGQDKNEEQSQNGDSKLVATGSDVFCSVCLVRLTSTSQAKIHFDGVKHNKALSLLLEHMQSLKAESHEDGVMSPSTDQNVDGNGEKEEDTSGLNESNDAKKPKKNDFFCEVCLVKLTSTSQIDIHLEGKKHKKAVEFLAEHPRSLADLAAYQERYSSQSFQQDDDHINNICVVRPTSRCAADVLSSEKRSSSRKKANKEITDVTSQNVDKDSDNSEKPKDGAPPKKRNKKPKGEEIFCDVCMVKLTSKVQAEKHNEGSKHKRALAIMAAPPAPLNPIVGGQNLYTNFTVHSFNQFANRNGSAQRVGYVGQTLARRMRASAEKECYCSICLVKLTSTSQAVKHYEGKQHKKVAAVAAATAIKKANELAKKQELLVCEVCNVTLSSQAVADSHYGGSRHSKKLQQLSLFRQNAGLVNEPVQAEKKSICDICIVSLPTKASAETHYAGARHSKKLKMIQSLRGPHLREALTKILEAGEGAGDSPSAGDNLSTSDNPSVGDSQTSAFMLNNTSSQEQDIKIASEMQSYNQEQQANSDFQAMASTAALP